MNPVNVGFYGVGNLGYALLRSFDSKNDNNLQLIAYDLNTDITRHLDQQRSHPNIHPDVRVSSSIKFVNSPEELLTNCQTIILSTPSTANKTVIDYLKKSTPGQLTIINTAKSLDISTGQRLSEIFRAELADLHYNYCLLAGGTIADEVFRLSPLGADLACQDEGTLHKTVNLFRSSHLNVTPTTDLIGVEYASALKNIVSIVAGIVHGLGLPYGSETYHISKTATAIANVCVNHLGASPSTFTIARQCWGNDMFMSATGNTRNRFFGVMLGQGVPADVALEEMTNQAKLIEGVNTLKAIQHLPPLAEIQLIKLLSQLILDGQDNLDNIRRYLTS